MLTKKEERMFGLVEKWRASGELQADFCRQHDISVSTLSYWVTRKNKAAQTPAQRGFVQVDAGPAPQSCQIELVYPNGVRVRADGANTALIGSLIRVW